jgi:1-deoxy-D-xylulose-5-phosphate reductoisomerase
MTDDGAADDLAARLSDTSVKVYGGADSLVSAITSAECDTVVNAILGEAGLAPSIASVKAGRRLALANKESLVIAGEIVMGLAKECGAEIIPVDSEHSAIFQSLKGGRSEEIRRLILTASGGPFFGRTRSELSSVTLLETLAHPTWKMGRKITVDSATLMNKGFEIIEAAHLFSVQPEKIEVVVHRESILHSAVEYIDNAIIGEFSLPDMRMCVQYAVDYPERCAGVGEPLDFAKLSRMTFASPDYEAFPLLSYAKKALSDGGAMAAVLNAADEVAVERFLSGEISFLGISDCVINAYERMSHAKNAHTLEDIISSDREAREIARRF